MSPRIGGSRNTPAAQASHSSPSPRQEPATAPRAGLRRSATPRTSRYCARDGSPKSGPQLATAREIGDKAEAENRALTAEEQKTYDPIVAKAREVADTVKAHRHDQEVFTFARELSDNVIGPLNGGELSGSSTEAKSRRLSFKGLGAKVTTQMLGQADETGEIEETEETEAPEESDD